MTPYSVSREELSSLFELDNLIAERIVETGASTDEVGAAIDDLEHERHYGERRLPASAKIAEIRAILEELDPDLDGGSCTFPIHGELLVR
jgi:hypothetical protein